MGFVEKVKDRKPAIKQVDLTEECGEVVYVRKLPTPVLVELQAEAASRGPATLPKMIVASLCTADGTQVVPEDEWELVGTNLSSGEFTKLMSAMAECNDIALDAVESEKKRFLSEPNYLFTFQLALALGMTRRRLMEEIDQHEFASWIAFAKVQPFDDPWLRNARLESMLSTEKTDFWTLYPGIKPNERTKEPQTEDDIFREFDSHTGG